MLKYAKSSKLGLLLAQAHTRKVVNVTDPSFHLVLTVSLCKSTLDRECSKDAHPSWKLDPKSSHGLRHAGNPVVYSLSMQLPTSDANPRAKMRWELMISSCSCPKNKLTNRRASSPPSQDAALLASETGLRVFSAGSRIILCLRIRDCQGHGVMKTCRGRYGTAVEFCEWQREGAIGGRNSAEEVGRV